MKFSIIADQICVLSRVNIGIFYEQMIADGHELIVDYMNADIIIFQPCQLVKVNQKLIDKIKQKKVKVIFCYKEDDFKEIKELDFISHDWIGKKENQPTLQRKDNHFIYIGSGCNNHCSYCPIKRDGVTSRSIESILKDAKDANKIMFCADDCSSYKYGLVNLLKKIPDKEITLSYVYPSYLVEHADYFIANKHRISIEVVPVQSASNRILKLMNRNNYNPSELLRVINNLKVNKIHFMFGYPTETWDDFLETVKWEEKLHKMDGFALWFKYNTYKGTLAEIRHGTDKNPLIDDMEKYLFAEKSKHCRAILNFLEEDYGSMIVGFNEKKEMFFHRASDLKRVSGFWDEDNHYIHPVELMGKKNWASLPKKK